MNGYYEPSSALTELLVALTDGDLDADQRRQLNQIVSADEAARDYYVRYISTHAMLEFRHQGSPVLDLPLERAAELVSRPSSSVSTWIGTLIALSILLVVAMAYYRFEYNDRMLAVGTFIEGSRIQSADGSIANDGLLHPGPAHVTQGIAHVTLNSGAHVAIVGPADIVVLGVNRFELKRGRLRAYIPPEAIGFTVVAGGQEIVDLGTDFGVAVEKNDEVEVHVFEGSVEVVGKQILRKYEAMRYDPTGNQVKPQLEAKVFPQLKW